MQEDKILAKTVADILNEIRTKTGKSLNLFCNEYSVPTTTLNNLENAKQSVKLFSLYKILKAYGYDTVEFFRELDKRLPDDFLKPEE